MKKTQDNNWHWIYKSEDQSSLESKKQHENNRSEKRVIRKCLHTVSSRTFKCTILRPCCQSSCRHKCRCQILWQLEIKTPYFIKARNAKSRCCKQRKYMHTHRWNVCYWRQHGEAKRLLQIKRTFPRCA